MKRWYYEKHIAAAWMMTEHGFRLTREAGTELVNLSVGLGVVAPGVITVYLAAGERAYVHADSLHLLEPQPKDLVFYGYGVYPHSGEAWDEVRAIVRSQDEQYPTMGDGEDYMLLDGGDYRPTWRLTRIILRDGKPFHCPLREAA